MGGAPWIGIYIFPIIFIIVALYLSNKRIESKTANLKPKITPIHFPEAFAFDDLLPLVRKDFSSVKEGDFLVRYTTCFYPTSEFCPMPAKNGVYIVLENVYGLCWIRLRDEQGNSKIINYSDLGVNGVEGHVLNEEGKLKRGSERMDGTHFIDEFKKLVSKQ